MLTHLAKMVPIVNIIMAHIIVSMLALSLKQCCAEV